MGFSLYVCKVRERRRERERKRERERERGVGYGRPSGDKMCLIYHYRVDSGEVSKLLVADRQTHTMLKEWLYNHKMSVHWVTPKVTYDFKTWSCRIHKILTFPSHTCN